LRQKKNTQLKNQTFTKKKMKFSIQNLLPVQLKCKSAIKRPGSVYSNSIYAHRETETRERVCGTEASDRSKRQMSWLEAAGEAGGGAGNGDGVSVVRRNGTLSLSPSLSRVRLYGGRGSVAEAPGRRRAAVVDGWRWAAVDSLDGGEGKFWEMAGAGGRRRAVDGELRWSWAVEMG